MFSLNMRRLADRITELRGRRNANAPAKTTVKVSRVSVYLGEVGAMKEEVALKCRTLRAVGSFDKSERLPKGEE